MHIQILAVGKSGKTICRRLCRNMRKDYVLMPVSRFLKSKMKKVPPVVTAGQEAEILAKEAPA